MLDQWGHMHDLTVKTVDASDDARIVDVVVLAFADDPVWRWLWPDAHQYLTSTPPFIRAFGGGAFTNNGAHCTSDYAGAALWLAPGVHPDEATLGEIIERTVSASIRNDLSSIFEQMAKCRTSEPHWYLPFIGVDPASQRNGHGSRLMAYALQQFDRDHMAAYLESTNPRNISFYRRHGFEPVGEIRAGTSPVITPMLRCAR
jgi:ribosomal protein S18 acetylase RimI-like enzyme